MAAKIVEHVPILKYSRCHDKSYIFHKNFEHLKKYYKFKIKIILESWRKLYKFI